MSDQFLSLDADYYQRWIDTGLTWPEFRERETRRKRMKRLAGYVAMVTIACLLAWVSVHIAVGRP